MLKTLNSSTYSEWLYFPRPFSLTRAYCLFQDDVSDAWFLDASRSSFVLPDNYRIGD